jgi:chemosensory pili system protein ChpA (sensor histidine kinase/response regulator)
MYHAIPRDLLTGLLGDVRARVSDIVNHIDTFRRDGARVDSLAEARRLAHQLKGDTSLAGMSSISHVAFFQETILETIIDAWDRRDEGLQVLNTLISAMEAVLASAESFLASGTAHHENERAAIAYAAVAHRRFCRLSECDDEQEIAKLLESLGPADARATDNQSASQSDSPVEPSANDTTEQLGQAPAPEWRDHLIHFREDALEQLRQATAAWSRYLSNDGQHDARDEIRRRVHCLKGSASVVGQHDIADLAHRFEDLLDRLDSADEPTAATIRDVVAFAFDVLGELVEGNPCPEQLRHLDESIQRLATPAQPSESPQIQSTSRNPSIEEILDAELVDGPSVASELAEVFAEEAKDHVATIYAGLEALQQDPHHREYVQQVRRATHTLKGAAGAVGLKLVARLSHRMEDLLDLLYEGGISVTPEIATLLFATTDMLEDMSVGQIDVGEFRSQFVRLFHDFDQHLARIRSGESPRAVDAPASTADARAEAAAAVAVVMPDNAEPNPSGQETAAADPTVPIPRALVTATIAGSATASESTPEAEPADSGSATRSAKDSGQILRVSLERLDELVRLISELIINRTSFEQRMLGFANSVDELKHVLGRLRTLSRDMETRYSIDALRERRVPGGDGASLLAPRFRFDGGRAQEFDALEFDRYSEIHLLARSLSEATSDVGTICNELRTIIGDFDSLLDRQGRLSRDAQDRLMHIRMVPLATIATRLNRAVRVVATSQRKNVQLFIEGSDTELDKTVLEEIADPLLHLVRNAVDHGIETPEIRSARGKPPTASIRITAFHQGTQAIIRVADDGNGLDPTRIRAALIQGNYLAATEVDALTAQELYRYIFLPGLSTASHVSEVSGRGVGMDIVRDKVEKLKGTISVDSTPERGTVFTIHLPLTLAITRALMVIVNHETYAIPMQSVTQILRLKRDAISRLGNRDMIHSGNSTYPLVSLANHLGLHGTESEPAEAIPVLIVQSGDRRIALSVDRILSGRDIVIKGLGNHLKRVPGLIGSTFLGDGTVVPILDSAYLVDAQEPQAQPRTPHRSRETRSHDEALSIMVVDDSVSVRRVMMNIVKNAGWIPVAAKDGVDAIEILQSLDRAPDAFLLDIEMPRMDGYELLSTLRGQAAYRHVPIVMVTSRSGDKHRQKAMDLGASGYIIKPFQDETVTHLIKNLVATARSEAFA